jgi:predicted aconitase with swiveling domain
MKAKVVSLSVLATLVSALYWTQAQHFNSKPSHHNDVAMECIALTLIQIKTPTRGGYASPEALVAAGRQVKMPKVVINGRLSDIVTTGAIVYNSPILAGERAARAQQGAGW